MNTGIHDTEMCKCEMCRWADEAERKQIQAEIDRLSVELAANHARLNGRNEHNQQSQSA